MRASPWEALARIDLTRLFLERGASGDVARAEEELGLAENLCGGLPVAGLEKLAEAARGQLVTPWARTDGGTVSEAIPARRRPSGRHLSPP